LKVVYSTSRWGVVTFLVLSYMCKLWFCRYCSRSANAPLLCSYVRSQPF